MGRVLASGSLLDGLAARFAAPFPCFIWPPPPPSLTPVPHPPSPTLPLHACSPCSVPEEAPSEVRRLILQCLEARPSLRPTALQLVEQLSAAPAAPPPGVTLLRSSMDSGSSGAAVQQPAPQQAGQQHQGLGQAEQAAELHAAAAVAAADQQQVPPQQQEAPREQQPQQQQEQEAEGLEQPSTPGPVHAEPVWGSGTSPTVHPAPERDAAAIHAHWAAGGGAAQPQQSSNPAVELLR